MKKLPILSLTILLSICSLTIAFAAYTPINRNLCALSIHPFNPLASAGDTLEATDSSWFNIFNQGDPHCDKHLVYPNQYTPQPPAPADAPLASVANIDKKTAPETIHNHKYFNDSVQDSKYYKSFTDSFQIILKEDALKNTDLNKIVCYSPGEGATIKTTNGCNGTLADWGGTEITFNKNTGIINWKFATSGKGRPRLYGTNPELNGYSGVMDTANEENRKLEFGVKLVSKDNPSTIWSATTVSRILVRDQAISTGSIAPGTNPDNISACNGDGTVGSSYDYKLWCTLPDSLIGASTKIEQKQVTSYAVNGKSYSTGGKAYYWKEIGPVTTIWQKPIAPPKKPPVACADLQWDGAFLKTGKLVADAIHPNALLENESALMKFKTTYEPGAGTKRPLEYDWVSFNGKQIGSFKDEPASAKSFNPLVDNDFQALYSGGSAGVTVGVQAFYTDGLTPAGQGAVVDTPDGKKQKAEKCHLELKIQPLPKSPAICVGLTINPNTIKPNTPVTFTVTPKFEPANSSIPLDYNWEAKSALASPVKINPAAPSINSPNAPNDKDGAMAKDLIGIASFGAFKDSAKSLLAAINPFLETTDNNTYYTGGPANTKISVQGQDKDGKVYPDCSASLEIPGMPPSTPICQQLVAKFLDGLTAIAKEDMVAGKTYNISIDQAASQKTDGSLISNYSVSLSNPTGDHGDLKADLGNAPSCKAVSDNLMYPATLNTYSTSVTCKYNYTAHAGDQLVLQADPTDGVAACTIKQTIPGGPAAICKNLNLTTSPLINGGTIPAGQLVALSTDPRDTTDAPRNPVVYTETGKGHFTADLTNDLACTLVPAESDATITFEAPNTCKYSYQPATVPDGNDTMSIKVKQDDNVAACSQNFTVPATPPPAEKCLSLNFKVNGAYTLNPAINPGFSYALQADPITTAGNPVKFIEWSENGSGQLIGQPFNPGICPASIDNQVVTIPSFCRYIFASPSGPGNIGFSARAVPDDNEPACKATAANYVPPIVPPYCLYLNLDTSATFNPLLSNNMNATVVMSDGSHYNDNVRFTTTDGAGNFSGGIPVSGSGTSDFRTKVDGSNNTLTVTYASGNATTALNVFLSDTSIAMSAACQRHLYPSITPPKECKIPPKITRTGNSNTFTTTVGDSASYCWSVSGPANPIFTNGLHTAVGNTVVLDQSYTDFSLEIHDCNSAYSYFCSDNYVASGTPHIEKKISKASTGNFVTKINYSTTGVAASFNEPVSYQLTYSPSDYTAGNLTASIYDPAFTGTIHGSKTKVNSDGTTTPVLGGDINVDLKSITVSSANSNYQLCTGSFTPLSPCFELNNPASTYPGFGALIIHGIQSQQPITITYDGVLHSSITTSECQNGLACNEKVINQSFVTDMKYCTESNNAGALTYPCTVVTTPTVCQQVSYTDITGQPQPLSPCNNGAYTIFSNMTSAELVCQYFLTRASGDIFLEDTLQYGIDVSKCYPFKNITSLITKPITPIDFTAPKTGGSNAEIININHEICSSGQNNFANTKLTPDQITQLKQLYGSDISNLSSQICEVGLVPGLVWTKDQITATIAQNIGKLTRWAGDINPPPLITNITDITNHGNVYYYKGSGHDTVTISSLNIPEGSGSLTIIVENADLQINGDIKYQPNGPAPTDAKSISSLGVIVIDGNMYVAPQVTTIAGAYFIQRSDPSLSQYGNIGSGTVGVPTPSDQFLTINGSIYGNIGPLFQQRHASGDVSQDQGAITIRYDQRIIQNPPEGLSELLGNFSQAQVAQ